MKGKISRHVGSVYGADMHKSWFSSSALGLFRLTEREVEKEYLTMPKHSLGKFSYCYGFISMKSAIWLSAQGRSVADQVSYETER